MADALKSFRVIAASIGAVCGLCIAGIAEAAVITTATGNGGDSYVQSGTNANTNFGSDPLVNVKADQANGSDNFNRKGYFKFDLSTVSELPSATSATLTFFLNNNPSPRVFNLFGLNDNTAGENFGETTITYTNAPGNDLASGGGPYDIGTGTGGGLNNSVTTFIGTFSPTASGTINITSGSAPQLLAFLNADTNDIATFIVTGATVQTAALDSFRSGENAGGASSFPTLTVVPEPSSVAIGLLGIVGMLARRRRQ